MTRIYDAHLTRGNLSTVLGHNLVTNVEEKCMTNANVPRIARRERNEAEGMEKTCPHLFALAMTRIYDAHITRGNLSTVLGYNLVTNVEEKCMTKANVAGIGRRERNEAERMEKTWVRKERKKGNLMEEGVKPTTNLLSTKISIDIRNQLAKSYHIPPSSTAMTRIYDAHITRGNLSIVLGHNFVTNVEEKFMNKANVTGIGRRERNKAEGMEKTWVRKERKKGNLMEEGVKPTTNLLSTKISIDIRN
ncbi:unnamed protein product [Ilex paraguariensis]|uniref:Uncharacterized protein n=1 Tax=Ilex paraguariensis TaxID=185542 RepID=A0ABC8T8C5_9AQUA